MTLETLSHLPARELRHMEFNCQINQSRNRYLHYEGRKGGLIVRVETGPPLACTVRKFTDDHEVESYIYPGKCDVETLQSTDFLC